MSISKKMIITIVVIIVVLVLIIGGIEFTSQTSFCVTCHNMKVYYETLKTSSHQEVDCIKCHIPPGLSNYIKTKLKGLSEVVVYTIGRPPLIYHAEVEDTSCLRKGCHSKDELLSNPVSFEKGITFQHSTHLRPVKNIQLVCTSCHSQIVHDRQVTVTSSTCFTCHFEGGEQ